MRATNNATNGSVFTRPEFLCCSTTSFVSEATNEPTIQRTTEERAVHNLLRFLLQANSSQSSSTSSTSSSNHGKLNMLHCIAIFIQSIRPPSCATANTMSSVHPSILRRSPFIPSWPPEGRGQIQRFYRSLELLESTTSSSSRCHHYSLCCCQLIVLNNIHLL